MLRDSVNSVSSRLRASVRVMPFIVGQQQHAIHLRASRSASAAERVSGQGGQSRPRRSSPALRPRPCQTAGRPDAIASSSDIGNHSTVRELSTKTSIAASTSGMSWRSPANVISCRCQARRRAAPIPRDHRRHRRSRSVRPAPLSATSRAPCRKWHAPFRTLGSHDTDNR
jgi:hypothetical protein